MGVTEVFDSNYGRAEFSHLGGGRRNVLFFHFFLTFRLRRHIDMTPISVNDLPEDCNDYMASM
jgi:hypothetical protein